MPGIDGKYRGVSGFDIICEGAINSRSMRIRTSSLPAHADCARRSIARTFPGLVREAGYEDLRQLLPSAGSSVGTAVHTAAAELLRAKRDGTPCTRPQAVEAAVEHFRTDTVDGAEWDDHTPTDNEALKQIQRMVASYERSVLPRVEPLVVEEYMEADAGDGFVLTGHVDLITVDGVIRDLKTGNVLRPYQAQLGGYSLLARSNGHLQRTRGVGVDYIERARVSRPQPDAIAEDFAVETCERAAVAALQHMKRDLRDLQETGDCWSIPANPLTLMCGRAWCPAHGTSFCHLWKETR